MTKFSVIFVFVIHFNVIGRKRFPKYIQGLALDSVCLIISAGMDGLKSAACDYYTIQHY